MIKLKINEEYIPLKVINFPDGQNDIKIEKDIFTRYPAQIISTFNNFQDLEIIFSLTSCLRRLGIKEINLYIPYLLGSRSDRQFEKGGSSYLKDVVCPLINLQNYNEVKVYDVHNSVMTDACLNNLLIEDNSKLVSWAIANIGDCTIVCPDEGASKKIYPLLNKIGYQNELIICSKKRETDGSISKTTILEYSDTLEKNIVIIDDICDGGRTFIEIVKKLQVGYEADFYLIVSHGIFSKDFEELSQYFKGIFCTNSIKEINNPILKQIKII